MNVRKPGLIVLAALAGATACKDNPTSAGSGTPAAVIANFSSFILAPGDSAAIIASIVDSRLTQLPGTITFSSCNSAVATVTPDPNYAPVPNTSQRAVIHAVSAPLTCILASAAGLKPDSIIVGVVPVAVPLVFAASANTGTTLAVGSTPLYKFTPATSTVTFGGGITPPVISATADTLKVLVPFSSAGVLNITDVNVTYANGLLVSRPTVASFTATSVDPFPGDNAWNTAPDITSLIPTDSGSVSQPFLVEPPASNAAGICPEDRFGFGPAGTCAFLKFTLADSTNVAFTTDWDPTTGSDIDLVICSDSTAANFNTTTFAPCARDGLKGASSNQPETAGTKKYGPGTYWFVIQNFAGTAQSNYYVTITRN
jgi:hypothetical protein